MHDETRIVIADDHPIVRKDSGRSSKKSRT